MKPYRLLPIAEGELQDAAKFLNADRPGFGNQLIEDLELLMDRLGRHPESGPKISRRLRVAHLNDYRYSVIYRNEADEIVVVAVAHQSRRPGYWKGRI